MNTSTPPSTTIPAPLGSVARPTSPTSVIAVIAVVATTTLVLICVLAVVLVNGSAATPPAVTVPVTTAPAPATHNGTGTGGGSGSTVVPPTVAPTHPVSPTGHFDPSDCQPGLLC